jgi:hypothetical protein
VNVFDLDAALIGDYERFARSFTQIRAPDIRRQVEAIYTSDRLWPEPLISINPGNDWSMLIERAEVISIEVPIRSAFGS